MALAAVDWGTSSLRGALLGDDGSVREERSLPRGILGVEPGGFPAVFASSFGDWMDAAPLALVCGMAGSRQGWMEAPYCSCPAGLQEIAGSLAWVQPGRIAIVPGLACDRDGTPDVMRGEETQVLGALDLLGLQDTQLVLPGTHSKWVRAVAGRIDGFATFMTGEVYGLLRRHSILARSMPEHEPPLDEEAFMRGLWHARQSAGLLQSAFSARTLSLFDRLAGEAAPSYLSGLVIGEELRAQGTTLAPGVVVVGDALLTRRYTMALKAWGVRHVRCVGSEAAWRGLWTLARTR
ncbi:MAG: 2-dehydro-3-deoxygalactonokinase [Burkholderiales bacterium]|nr:2-dehydro-3-deoxygalactonokinase [Burkholderiales bacterium]